MEHDGTNETHEAMDLEELHEHEHELPVLAGIAACLRWLEELVALLSGPLLMAGLGLRLVALLSHGQPLGSAPRLGYAWATSPPGAVSAQLVACRARVSPWGCP